MPNRICGRVLALLVCAATASLLPGCASAASFLAFGTISFDPVQDDGMARLLWRLPPDRWDSAVGPGGSGPDGSTGVALLHSALDAARDNGPAPSFVLLGGGILSTGLKARFQAATGEKSDLAWDEFARSAFRYVLSEVGARFPGVPVFVAPGDGDEDCSGPSSAPGGFRASLASTLAAAARIAGSPIAFLDTWTRLGSYELPVPGTARTRMLVLDPRTLRVRSRSACPDKAASGAREVLDWMSGRMEAARAEGAGVWVVSPMPPGVDAEATLREGTCPSPAVRTMAWGAGPEFEDTLSAAARAGQDVTGFFSSTGAEDYRMVGEARGGGASTLMLGLPSLAPGNGRPPAFQFVSYDPAGHPGQASTWRFDGSEWQAAPDFPGNAGKLDLGTVAAVRDKEAADPPSKARWMLRYGGSPAFWAGGPGKPDPSAAIAARWCASGSTWLESYSSCRCPGG